MYVATLGLPMVAPANIFFGVVQLWADQSVYMPRILVFRFGCQFVGFIGQGDELLSSKNPTESATSCGGLVELLVSSSCSDRGASDSVRVVQSVSAVLSLRRSAWPSRIPRLLIVRV